MHLAKRGMSPLPAEKKIPSWYINMALIEYMDKGSQLGAFFPKAIVYCYLEFKLHCLKNLKLFSIRVKGLFEPIALRNKADRFLLFLKAFSWESNLRVTLDDFGKKHKIWKGNLYLTENWLSRNEMWCVTDI